MASAVQNMQLMANSMNLACYWSSWDSSARDSSAMRVSGPGLIIAISRLNSPVLAHRDNMWHGCL